MQLWFKRLPLAEPKLEFPEPPLYQLLNRDHVSGVNQLHDMGM